MKSRVVINLGLVKHAQYYWLLLSQKPSDAAAVRGDGAKDCRLTGGDGLDGGCLYAKSKERR